MSLDEAAAFALGPVYWTKALGPTDVPQRAP